MKKNLFYMLLSLSVVNAVQANPGQYQINQACVDVGCFSGDNPNTQTIEITQASGTFVLTSDLEVDNNQNGSPVILVSRAGGNSAVTIDMNGYEIRHTGGASSNTDGIQVRGEDSVVSILNGRISRLNDGINAINAASVMVDNMVFQYNRDDGVQAPQGTIKNSVFQYNNYAIYAFSSSDQYVGDNLYIKANQFNGQDQQFVSIGRNNLCKDNRLAFIGSSSNLGNCTLTGFNLCGSSECVATGVDSVDEKNDE